MTATTTRARSSAPNAASPVAHSPAHQRFFAAGRAQVVDEHDGLLWETLQGLTASGKRFRPAIFTEVYTVLGGQDHQAAARVADAVELLHTAFVIHDDVIDGDQVRRGRPNVGGTFSAHATDVGATPERARHYGDAAGILAGDLALAGAVREMALCGARPEVVVRLLDLLEDVLHRSAAGELADVRVSLTADASVGEVLDIAEWKTAAYSFQLPLQAAALLADADAAMVADLGRLGRYLGIAFQLRDDLDGVFGTETQTGKDPLCDLREGKCTALITLARSSPVWGALAPLVGNPDLTPQQAQQARDLLVACGARQQVESIATELREAARAVALTLPGPASAALVDTIDLLVPPTTEQSSVGERGAEHATTPTRSAPSRVRGVA